MRSCSLCAVPRPMPRSGSVGFDVEVQVLSEVLRLLLAGGGVFDFGSGVDPRPPKAPRGRADIIQHRTEICTDLEALSWR